MARNEALLGLHKILMNRRAELRKRLGIELADLSRGKSAQGDAADAAFDASGEEMASQLAELESKELAQVERAIKRLKQGSYGQCESCSSKILIARLNALPFSTLCIKCQREMESDSGWMSAGADEDWTRISDHDHSMDDRQVKMADLESELR